MMISFLIWRKHIGFDDIALDNYINYRQQLINYSRQHRINSERRRRLGSDSKIEIRCLP
jgi:hypothetical protein